MREQPCSRSWGGLLRIATALYGIVASANDCMAETASKFTLDSIQKIAVPDDDPKAWPLQDQTWVPINREDYLRKLSRLVTPADKPGGPQWRRVRYSAALAGETLATGRLSAELQRNDGSARYLPLGNPTVAIEELFWSDAPATWGTATDGRHWLKLEPEADRLEGRWSARGRPLELGVAFDLELLPAAISEIQLQTPIDQIVTSDVGDVEVTSRDSTAGWAHWRISLGDLFRCRIIVSPRESSPEPIPTMLYDQELTVNVGQEELQIGQTFLVESLGGDVSRFTISLPRALEIVSVSSGDQSPLTFERISGEGPASQIVVTLPEGSQGRLRTFRLDGYLRRAPGEPVAVPQFMLEGGLWMKGRVNVFVGRPMELRWYRSPGYRQTVPASKPSDGELISFQQLLPRAQLLLNVERPSVERVAHTINQLTTGPREWMLTTEIAWESRSGTVFDAACRIPDGWQVISVVRLGSGRESQELTDWTLEPHPEAGQLLTLEFQDGLPPGRVDPMRIIARRDVASGRPPAVLPVTTPVDCEVSEVLLQVDEPVMKRLSLKSADQLEPYDPQSAATVWNTLPAWSSAADATRELPLLHVIHPESSLPLSAVGSNTLVKVDVDLQIALKESRIIERFEMRLEGLGIDERSIELRFAERTPGIRWTSADHEVELPTKHRDSGVDSRRAAGGQGDVYVVSLPDRDADHVTLLGQREVAWTGDYVVPAVVAPHARNFAGRIGIRPDESEGYVLQTRDSQAAKPAESLISEPIEWAYGGGETSWRISRQRPSLETAKLSYRLKSVLTGDEGGFDYHELTVRASTATSFDGCRFRLSPHAEFIAAWSNQRTLTVIHDGEDWTIAGAGAGSDRSELILAYRIPTTTLFSRIRHDFEVPRLPGTCESFAWQISAPKSMEFRRAPLGLAMTPAPVPSHWWRRLRGPLSQSPADALSQAAAVATRPAGFERLSGEAADHSEPALTSIAAPENFDVYFLSSPELPNDAAYLVWNRTTSQITAWLCLVGCLPAGWLLRRWTGGWRDRLLAVLIGSSACLAVFGPDGWNEFSGSVFSGLMISLLLPRGSWKFAQRGAPASADHSASTEIFRRAAIPFAIWLTLGWAVPRSVAQQAIEPSEVDADARGTRQKLFRVLMPVDQNQRPSDKLPVVYVSPDLNELLNAMNSGDEADPPQLISSADYLLYLDQSGRQMLRIQYEIACPEGAPAPTLQVPLAPVWRRNLEACFVDGQSQSATTTTDETSLLIPAPPATTDDVLPNRRAVRMEVALPQSLNPQSGELRGILFPVLNSRLNWRSPEALSHVQIPQARGSVTISLDRRLLEAQLGAVRELSIRQTPEEKSNGPEGKAEMHLLQILNLRPMLTQVTFRVECRVVDGAVQRLDVELPPGGVLRDLRSHKVLQTSVLPRPDGGAKAVVEFSEPQRQDFVVEGEYVLPRTSLDQAIEFPRLQVRSGGSGPAKQSVAVGCAPEFTAQLINLDDPAVLPILVDAFFTQWGDTFPNQRPQFAFQVQEGGQPSFRLTPVQSDQQVLSWHENVVLSRKGLGWELNAEMRTTAWPAYSFTVLLDRRLTLDSVSVTENGVELLARTSKTPMIGSSQNRVTMFLNKETAAACQIQIHGAIRFRPTTPMLLPSVRFETPQTAPGSLALYHETGYRLQLEGRQAEPDAGSAVGELLAEQPNLQLFKQLKLQEGDTGLTARLEPIAGSCAVQALWLIDTSGPSWGVRGWTELTPENGTREVRIIVPDWLRESKVLLTPDESPPFEEISDGQRVLRIVCSGQETAPLTLSWEAAVPATDQSALTLNLPMIPQAKRRDDLAAVLPVDDWVVSAAPAIGITNAPVVIREQLTQWKAESVVALTPLSNGELPMRRVDANSPDGRSSVVLVEHVLRGTQDGFWRGHSTFYPAQTAGLVDIILPKGLEIVALSGDRTPILGSERSSDAGHWLVADASQYRRLTVRWKSPIAPGRRLFAGRRSAPLPSCRQERQPATFVAIHGSQQSWLVAPRDFRRRTSAELSIDALEVELRRYRPSPDGAEGGAVAGQRIWKRYRTAAERLAETGAIEQLSNADLGRWQTIVPAVNRIPESPETPDTWSPEADLDRIHFAEADSVVGILADQTSELNYWLVRRELVTGFSAALLLLACVWLLPNLTRWLLSPGWEHDRSAAWLLFGVVWWICWSPKIVALAMMAWAVAEWLQKRRSQLAVAGR